MKIIYLLHGKQAFVSDADYRKVYRYRWYMLQSGYVFRRVRRGQKQHARYLHHEIKGVSTGQEVDHKNRIRHDCRRANLRVCTSRQNKGNANKTGRATTSAFKGVCWDARRERWRAQVAHRHLGYFLDESGAARAYDSAAREVFGQFAKLNL